MNVRVGDTTVEVRIEDERARSAFDIAFAPLATLDHPDHQADVFATGDGRFQTMVDGETITSTTDVAMAVDHLVSWCNLRAVLSRPAALNLHAAGVVDPHHGRGIVFPAAPGSGKSTLAMAACRSGWGYLSDELVSVDPSGAALAYPKPITTKPGARALFDVEFDRWTVTDRQTRWYIHPAAMGGRVLPGGDVHAIVFARHDPTAATEVSVIGVAEAAMELALNCQGELSARGNALVRFAELAAGVHRVRLAHRELDTAMSHVEAVAALDPPDRARVEALGEVVPAAHRLGPCARPGIVGVIAEDGVVVFDPDRGQLTLLDPVAGVVWRLLDGSVAAEHLVHELAHAFDQPEAAVAADIQALLGQLDRDGLLVQAS